jgi:DNA-binding XRE family transcriptional regulator
MDAHFRLTAFVSERALTPQKLGELIGISRISARAILRGEATPSLETAHAIERVTARWKGGRIKTEEWIGEARR